MSLSSHIGGVTDVTVTPAAYEIAVPFHINASGDIAAVTDPVQRAIQHLLTLALTVPGERVMRPTYGIGIQFLVFSPADLTAFQAAANQLQAAYQRTDGGFVVTEVTVRQLDRGNFAFAVSFNLDEDPVVHHAIFDYAGNLVGAS